MKVNTSLCKGIANQWKDKDDTMIFSPEVHVLANTLVPIVSTSHLVVWWLIGITRQAHMLGTARTYPKSECTLMTCSTSVALHGSRGVSTVPLTFTSPKHYTIFLACFDGDHHQAV
jgi:hypothetical protein